MSPDIRPIDPVSPYCTRSYGANYGNKDGEVRRAGTSLHDVTRPQFKGEFTPAEWNSIWAAERPSARLPVYASKGWQLHEIPVKRAP